MADFAGLQTFAADGRVQFDSETMMFGLVGKGQVGFTSNAAVVNPNKHPIYSAFVGSLPYHQFAVLACTAPCSLQIASAANTPVNGFTANVKALSGVSFTLSYWLFSAYALLPDLGYGFQAFNANGQKCLDLAYSPLRIIANTPVSINNGHNTNQDYAVPDTAGKTLGYLRYGTVENRTSEVLVSPGPNDPATAQRNFRGVPVVAARSNGFNFQEGQATWRDGSPINVAAGGILTCDMTNL
ncbi:hypothetical protein [Novosphingobium sp.]|uniref:hypothetical protein n=1 Tax=Novosphingobium sp. TaxID=1874826 RepID=UPI003D6C9AB4